VSTLWDREANSIRKKWLGVAAAILVIPEIKEGQELREKARSYELLSQLLAVFLLEEEYPTIWEEVTADIQEQYRDKAKALLDRLASGESR
ncbi:hypothetical protein LCGC14_2602510, partial [marine sediment metagenome]